MPGTTICGLADGAGWPVKTAVRKFRAEFEQYIRSGKKSYPLPTTDKVAVTGEILRGAH
jgi:hypothetical protein